MIARPDRRPQLFDTMTGWREIALGDGLPFWEVAVQYEMDAPDGRATASSSSMRQLAAASCAARPGPCTRRASRCRRAEFKPDFARPLAALRGAAGAVSDGVTAQTIRYAYGAGSGIPGVEAVPGPMGGGGGYIHAALSAVQEARGLSDDDLLRGLFVAAGVGAIAYTRSAPTGEVHRLYRRVRHLRRHGRGGDRRAGRGTAARHAENAGFSRPAGLHRHAVRPHAGWHLPALPQPHHGGDLHGARVRRPGARRPRGGAAAARGAGRGRPIGRALPPELKCTSEGGCLYCAVGAGLQSRVPPLVRREPPGGQAAGNLI